MGGNFLVMFSSSTALRAIEKREGMASWYRPQFAMTHDYVLNMQHVTTNSKRWDYSDIAGGGHKKITGPTHMAECGHHLTQSPTH